MSLSILSKIVRSVNPFSKRPQADLSFTSRSPLPRVPSPASAEEPGEEVFAVPFKRTILRAFKTNADGKTKFIVGETSFASERDARAHIDSLAKVDRDARELLDRYKDMVRLSRDPELSDKAIHMHGIVERVKQSADQARTVQQVQAIRKTLDMVKKSGTFAENSAKDLEIQLALKGLPKTTQKTVADAVKAYVSGSKQSVVADRTIHDHVYQQEKPKAFQVDLSRILGSNASIMSNVAPMLFTPKMVEQHRKLSDQANAKADLAQAKENERVEALKAKQAQLVKAKAALASEKEEPKASKPVTKTKASAAEPGVSDVIAVRAFLQDLGVSIDDLVKLPPTEKKAVVDLFNESKSREMKVSEFIKAATTKKSASVPNTVQGPRGSKPVSTVTGHETVRAGNHGSECSTDAIRAIVGGGNVADKQRTFAGTVKEIEAQGYTHDSSPTAAFAGKTVGQIAKSASLPSTGVAMISGTSEHPAHVMPIVGGKLAANSDGWHASPVSAVVALKTTTDSTGVSQAIRAHAGGEALPHEMVRAKGFSKEQLDFLNEFANDFSEAGGTASSLRKKIKSHETGLLAAVDLVDHHIKNLEGVEDQRFAAEIGALKKGLESEKNGIVMSMFQGFLKAVPNARKALETSNISDSEKSNATYHLDASESAATLALRHWDEETRSKAQLKSIRRVAKKDASESKHGKVSESIKSHVGGGLSSETVRAKTPATKSDWTSSPTETPASIQPPRLVSSAGGSGNKPPSTPSAVASGEMPEDDRPKGIFSKAVSFFKGLFGGHDEVVHARAAPEDDPSKAKAELKKVAYRKPPNQGTHGVKLAREVKARGGIKPDSLAPFMNPKEAVENGLLGILNKNGTAIDDLAQTLESEGHFHTPSGRKADDYLVELLQQGAHSLVNAVDHIEKKLEREHAEYLKQAHDAGIEERDITEATRVGQEAGDSEASQGDAFEDIGAIYKAEDLDFDPDKFEPLPPKSKPAPSAESRTKSKSNRNNAQSVSDAIKSHVSGTNASTEAFEPKALAKFKQRLEAAQQAALDAGLSPSDLDHANLKVKSKAHQDLIKAYRRADAGYRRAYEVHRSSQSGNAAKSVSDAIQSHISGNSGELPTESLQPFGNSEELGAATGHVTDIRPAVGVESGGVAESIKEAISGDQSTDEVFEGRRPRQGKDGQWQVQAKAGGEVSPVNGEFYKGGRWMPIHGLSPKVEAKPTQQSGAGSLPSGREEGKKRTTSERVARGPMTPEEIEAERDRRARQSQWDEMRAGPLGQISWLGEHPNAKGGSGVNLSQWQDFIGSKPPEYIQSIIKAIEPEAHGSIDRGVHEAIAKQAGKPTFSGDRLLTSDDAQWEKDELRRRADETVSQTRLTKKLEKDKPGAMYARELIQHLMQDDTNRDKVGRLYKIHKLLSAGSTINSEDTAGGRGSLAVPSGGQQNPAGANTATGEGAERPPVTPGNVVAGASEDEPSRHESTAAAVSEGIKSAIGMAAAGELSASSQAIAGEPIAHAANFSFLVASAQLPSALSESTPSPSADTSTDAAKAFLSRNGLTTESYLGLGPGQKNALVQKFSDETGSKVPTHAFLKLIRSAATSSAANVSPQIEGATTPAQAIHAHVSPPAVTPGAGTHATPRPRPNMEGRTPAEAIKNTVAGPVNPQMPVDPHVWAMMAQMVANIQGGTPQSAFGEHAPGVTPSQAIMTSANATGAAMPAVPQMPGIDPQAFAAMAQMFHMHQLAGAGGTSGMPQMSFAGTQADATQGYAPYGTLLQAARVTAHPAGIAQGKSPVAMPASVQPAIPGADNPQLGQFLAGQRHSFESSNVAHAVYDRDQRRLRIGYKDGSYHGYGNVTSDEATAFFNAPSKGKWVWDNLKVRGTVHEHQVPHHKIRVKEADATPDTADVVRRSFAKAIPQHFATGGYVRNSGGLGADDQPVRASVGEFIVPKDAARANHGILSAITGAPGGLLSAITGVLSGGIGGRSDASGVSGASGGAGSHIMPVDIRSSITLPFKASDVLKVQLAGHDPIPVKIVDSITLKVYEGILAGPIRNIIREALQEKMKSAIASTTWEDVKKHSTTAKDVATSVWNGAKSKWPDVVDAGRSAIETGRSVGRSVGETVYGKAAEKIPGIVEAGKSTWEAAKGTYKTAAADWPNVVETGKATWESAKDTAKNAGKSTYDLLDKTSVKIADALGIQPTTKERLIKRLPNAPARVKEIIMQRPEGADVIHENYASFNKQIGNPNAINKGIQGVYSPVDDRIDLRPLGASQKGTWAHEMAHSFDRFQTLSRTPEWKNIWQEEIKEKPKSISAYAKASPAEGFAELVSSAWMGEGNEKGYKKASETEHPKAFEFLKKHGLLGEGEETPHLAAIKSIVGENFKGRTKDLLDIVDVGGSGYFKSVLPSKSQKADASSALHEDIDGTKTHAKNTLNTLFKSTANEDEVIPILDLTPGEDPTKPPPLPRKKKGIRDYASDAIDKGLDIGGKIRDYASDFMGEEGYGGKAGKAVGNFFKEGGGGEAIESKISGFFGEGGSGASIGRVASGVFGEGGSLAGIGARVAGFFGGGGTAAAAGGAAATGAGAASGAGATVAGAAGSTAAAAIPAAVGATAVGGTAAAGVGAVVTGGTAAAGGLAAAAGGIAATLGVIAPPLAIAAVAIIALPFIVKKLTEFGGAVVAVGKKIVDAFTSVVDWVHQMIVADPGKEIKASVAPYESRAAAFNPAAVERFNIALDNLAAAQGRAFTPAIESGTRLANAFNVLYTEAAPQISQFVGAISEFRNAFSYEAQSGLVPMIASFAESLAPMIRNLRPIPEFFGSIIRQLSMTAQTAGEAFSPMINAFRWGTEVVGSFFQAMQPLVGAVFELARVFITYTGDFLRLFSAVTGLSSVVSILQAAFEFGRSQLTLFVNQIAAATAGLSAFVATMRAVISNPLQIRNAGTIFRNEYNAARDRISLPANVVRDGPRTVAAQQVRQVGLEEIGQQARQSAFGGGYVEDIRRTEENTRRTAEGIEGLNNALNGNRPRPSTPSSGRN